MESILTPRGLVNYNTSEEAIQAIAALYGSTNYKLWSDIRRPWYSKVNYPEAGQQQLTFFSSVAGQGTTTLDDTNIPKSNSFGQQHVVVKSIQLGLWVKTWDLYAWAGTNASTLVSDLLAGFVQAGVLTLTVNNRAQVQLPKPFLYAPIGGGPEQIYTAGLSTLTLTEGTPNVIATSISAAPYAEISGYRNSFILDPQLMIEAEQNFSLTLDFPSGLVPVLGTDVTDDTSNPLKVVAIIDSVTIRPATN
jgi:hypothetical protein